MLIDLKQHVGKLVKPLSLVPNVTPLAIEIRVQAPALIKFDDSSVVLSSCIKCPDQPCIKYGQEERNAAIAAKFRVDSTMHVCASDAITWSLETNIPTIDADLCTLCGVCASRCPTKAIFLSADSAKISTSLTEKFASNSLISHEATRNIFKNLKIAGEFIIESELILSTALSRVSKISGRTRILNPNLLIRNLLRTLGISAEAYSQGVQYNTVDLIFPLNDLIGACEVEFSNAALDNPRNLAAITAFLVSRHKYRKDKVLPLSCVLRLPQGREQYWMVIDDIGNVLGLNIHTLTLGALLILVWSRRTLSLPNEKLLLSQKRQSSLRPYLESLLGRKIVLSEGFENQLEPSKLIGQ